MKNLMEFVTQTPNACLPQSGARHTKTPQEHLRRRKRQTGEESFFLVLVEYFALFA
jgi:hypothetical protein